tara:strand:- start:1065 stop:1571 length:507 start_codon:yes stop_codon:yes gene_type:complete
MPLPPLHQMALGMPASEFYEEWEVREYERSMEELKEEDEYEYERRRRAEQEGALSEEWYKQARGNKMLGWPDYSNFLLLAYIKLKDALETLQPPEDPDPDPDPGGPKTRSRSAPSPEKQEYEEVLLPAYNARRRRLLDNLEKLENRLFKNVTGDYERLYGRELAKLLE